MVLTRPGAVEPGAGWVVGGMLASAPADLAGEFRGAGGCRTRRGGGLFRRGGRVLTATGTWVLDVEVLRLRAEAADANPAHLTPIE